MSTYKIHFPNGTIRIISNNTSNEAYLTSLYSFVPAIDLVFWINKYIDYRYFQIAEMSEEDIYVEEISDDLYHEIISGKPKNYFYFAGDIYD